MIRYVVATLSYLHICINSGKPDCMMYTANFIFVNVFEDAVTYH